VSLDEASQLIETDWRQDYGQNYLRRIRDAGKDQSYVQLFLSVAPAIKEVYRRQARLNGWSEPTEAQLEWPVKPGDETESERRSAEARGDEVGPQGTEGSEAVQRSIARQVAEGKPVKLFHWSKQSDLKVLDPAFHGTGIPGEEKGRARDYPDAYVPRLYFGGDTYKPEQGLGPHKYEATIEPTALYDIYTDPDDLSPTYEEVEEVAGWPGPAAGLTFSRKRFTTLGTLACSAVRKPTTMRPPSSVR
jgi:hypothetical protein